MAPSPNAISFHDSLAPVWEQGYDSDTFSVRVRVLSSLIPKASLRQHWLDAGCGTGTLSRWLVRERSFSVVAIDGSEQMLLNASRKPGLEYRRADVINTGLSEGSFDGVLCSSVLEYLSSVEAALQEFWRVLKPGGTLIASVPNASLRVRIPLKTVYWLTRPLGRKRWYTFLDHSKHCYSVALFAEMLQGMGFSTERMVEFGDLGLPFGLRAGAPGTLIMALARKT
jgi:ubiquinone/menaquinone biosynthesis C-methylase UbiE